MLHLQTGRTLCYRGGLCVKERIISRGLDAPAKFAPTVTSQIFNLECYTLGHHAYHILFCFWPDPRNSTQLNDP